MTIEQAASAVNEFKPKVVIPYHYRGKPEMSYVCEDGEEFGGEEVEVVLRAEGGTGGRLTSLLKSNKRTGSTGACPLLSL